MFTQIQSVEKISAQLKEIFYNKQNKITSLSEDSAISAQLFAIAKVVQKAQSDIALVESQRLPRNSSGAVLDKNAVLYGTPTRLSASGSRTYVLVQADAGTIYLASQTRFTSQTGITFEMTDTSVTIPNVGFEYISVRSTTTGENTNVKANTITAATSPPTGHSTVVNPVNSTGGRDYESDNDFRNRIQSHNNIVAEGTLSKLTEIARESNTDILTIKNYGVDIYGDLNLCIVLQNGQELTVSELDDLLEYLEPYLAITDLNKFNQVSGVVLVNPVFYPINSTTGIDFRVELSNNADIATVRQSMLLRINNYLDFRNWDYTKKVEWDDLLSIIKETQNVKYVPDNYFLPATDETIPYNALPRIQNFRMRDMEGNLLLENTDLVSIYYPNI